MRLRGSDADRVLFETAAELHRPGRVGGPLQMARGKGYFFGVAGSSSLTVMI